MIKSNSGIRKTDVINRRMFIIGAAKIVIFVDCGSNSIEIVKFLKKNNIEVLIIDHHHINNKLPSTLNIINPMKNPKEYKSQNICAAALTFYLINFLKYECLHIK